MFYPFAGSKAILFTQFPPLPISIANISGLSKNQGEITGISRILVIDCRRYLWELSWASRRSDRKQIRSKPQSKWHRSCHRGRPPNRPLPPAAQEGDRRVTFLVRASTMGWRVQVGGKCHSGYTNCFQWGLKTLVHCFYRSFLAWTWNICNTGLEQCGGFMREKTWTQAHFMTEIPNISAARENGFRSFKNGHRANIWATCNNSRTWKKLILGWFLSLTMIPVRSS